MIIQPQPKLKTCHFLWLQ